MRSERLAPLSLRQRASLLYEGRRSAVLSEPVDAMRRAGLHPVIDPRSRHAISRIGHDIAVEVGFASSFRIFGALIDTLWTGKREGVRLPSAVIGYRFGRRGRFVPKTRSGRAGDVAEELNADAVLRPLLERAELKDVHLAQGPYGRSVHLRPLAGTITALYFPPLPPYTVLIRPDEADAQLALLTRLLTGVHGRRSCSQESDDPRD